MTQSGHASEGRTTTAAPSSVAAREIYEPKQGEILGVSCPDWVAPRCHPLARDRRRQGSVDYFDHVGIAEAPDLNNPVARLAHGAGSCNS